MEIFRNIKVKADEDISSMTKRSVNIYNPPYKSDIEDIFAYNLEKYVSPSVKVKSQYEIKTPLSSFYLDFLLEFGKYKIGVECDGKDYHKNRNHDDARDALILGTGLIDGIFHFEGKLIYYQPSDVMYIIMRRYPDIFHEKGKSNLETLASKYLVDHYTNCELLYIDETNITPYHENADGYYEGMNDAFDYEDDDGYKNDVESKHVIINTRYCSFKQSRYYYMMFDVIFCIYLLNQYKELDALINAIGKRREAIDNYWTIVDVKKNTKAIAYLEIIESRKKEYIGICKLLA
ncbi:MAG: hypothetical protein AMQ22_02171 [Candidatus Methanofastidiosum methylothiophilum]|uniref:Uncharacterized protein n=1 Tax=Candidatus Methanofastidiosum methylothiophilum TaxID=1705564 RepID=A0A150IMR7_9EURY|nr:MAG: hypothetical protein AMQ22_02171 [Candidatus Methanofastidiosum methylthiophilus]